MRKVVVFSPRLRPPKLRLGAKAGFAFQVSSSKKILFGGLRRGKPRQCFEESLPTSSRIVQGYDFARRSSVSERRRASLFKFLLRSKIGSAGFVGRGPTLLRGKPPNKFENSTGVRLRPPKLRLGAKAGFAFAPFELFPRSPKLAIFG